ncbi:MAG: hypothetical protein FVQ85_05200 [Planctomycetes bacterium]|nr:hypothetical protein [Planctomycetota bacterium]
MKTMLGIFEKKTKQNVDEFLRDEISQVYLDPNYIVEILSSIFAKNINAISGHIHFHFQDKSDHAIFFFSEGKLRKIAAKSPECKKGQYVHWRDSEFCDYEHEDVLQRFHDKIECIEIYMDGLRKKWSSYPKFMKWLVENE